MVPPSTRADIQALLGGTPFRHNLSCQVNKESMTLQVRIGLEALLWDSPNPPTSPILSFSVRLTLKQPCTMTPLEAPPLLSRPISRPPRVPEVPPPTRQSVVLSPLLTPSSPSEGT